MDRKARLAAVTGCLATLDDDDLHAVWAFATYLASRRTDPEARAERAGWPHARRREMMKRRDTPAAEPARDDSP